MPMAECSEASIVRIAGAGFRLSLLLNAAACQLAQSRIEIHSIAKGVSLFSLTLKHVGHTLDITSADLCPELIEKAWEIANQGQMVFVEIEHMLEKLQSTETNEELRRLPMQERLMWCFRKQHVTYLLACLESLKLSLIVMTQVMELAELISSSADSTALSGLASLSADDSIAQQKAETQNTIIVRYWSVKRLDRLWDMVELEALEAAKDPTSQKINYGHASNTAAAMKPLVAATKGPGVSKLHVQTFGNIDVELSDIERSPKDMVHLSESAMNRLLALWVPSLRYLSTQGIEKSVRYADGSSPRQVFASSESDNESQDKDFNDYHDHEGARGYYLEGNTTDWRKPQSQRARYDAAQMRQRYSGYQAHVESDSDTDADDAPREAKARRTPPSPENELKSVSPQSANAHRTNGGRTHSNSFTAGYPPHPSPSQYPDASAKPAMHHSDSFPLPTQSMPRPQQTSHPPPVSPSAPYPPQPYRYPSNQDYYKSTPRSIPVNPNRPNPHLSTSSYSPRGTPPSPLEPAWNRPLGYSNGMLQPRHPASHSLSTSSPESTSRLSPPRSAQRSPTQSRRSSREETRNRNKELTRSATRGLAGIGAIAGFMDALEAFQIL